MNYITVTKLQNKLDGEANQSIVRKLVDKMIRDGYVEAKGSRRLGLSSEIDFLLDKIWRIELSQYILIWNRQACNPFQSDWEKAHGSQESTG